MKSQKQIQKAYEELLAEIEKVKDICLNCGETRINHTAVSASCETDEKGVGKLDGPYFKLNEIGLLALQNRQRVFEFVLERDQSYVSIDDCIMPETIVASISPHDSEDAAKYESLLRDIVAKRQLNPETRFEVDVPVDWLDEPYRTILLGSSNKLPVMLPEPKPEHIECVSFVVFPSGAVFRNFNRLAEIMLLEQIKEHPKEVKQHLKEMLNEQVVEEIINRYGGR